MLTIMVLSPTSTYLLFLMAHIFSKAAQFKKAKVSDLIVFAHDVTRSRGVTRVGFPIQMHQTLTVPSFSPSFNVPRSITQNGMVSRLLNAGFKSCGRKSRWRPLKHTGLYCNDVTPNLSDRKVGPCQYNFHRAWSRDVVRSYMSLCYVYA